MRSRPTHKPNREESAFNIFELMLVLATIGVLIVTIMTAWANTKPNNQAVQCLNNLRQWGDALRSAASDNDDMVPRDGSDNNGTYGVDTGATTGPGSPADSNAWFNVAPEYFRERSLASYFQDPGVDYKAKMPFPGGRGPIWHCPAAKAAPADVFLQNGRLGFFSYVVNIDLKVSAPITSSYSRIPYPTMPRIGAVPKPAATVLMTETVFSPTFEAILSTSSDATRNGIFPCARGYRFSARHNGGGVLTFIDGHAATFKRSYITNGLPDDSGANRAEKKNPDVIWDIYR